MVECKYCGDELQKAQGKMLVRQSGEKVYFCSSKCEKNWKKNRQHDYPSKEE